MGTRLALAAAFALLALAPAAQAAPRYVGSAAATITSCRADGFTASASVRSLSARTRRPAAVRGATLQVRLDAVPLFGLPRPGQWRDLGRRSSGTHSETFAGLGFDTWTAVVRYRYRRGRTNVLRGDQRSESRRVGRARGRAFCTVAEGAKPRDTRPPSVFIFPSDDRWRRGPLSVAVAATDDFSGVQHVLYRVDGGALQSIRNGGTFELAAEGAHAVEVAASDVAGNWSPTLMQTLRVDSAPPSAPGLSLPRPVTASNRPEIRWSASTDSGSGVQGYYVAIKRADGSTAGAQNVGPETTSIQSPVTLEDGRSYRVEVTAFDGADPAYVNGSGLDFRVDATAQVTSASPGEGSILTGGTTQTFTLTLDRPADPSTLAGNVFLDRHGESGSDPAVNVACGNADCSTVAVTPQSGLGEGRYGLRLTSGVRSQEGTAFQPFAAAYSVAFFQDDTDTFSSGACLGDPASPPRPMGSLSTTDPAENGTVSFNWSFSGPGTWVLRVRDGTTSLAATQPQGAGSGTSTVTFDMPDNGTLNYVVEIACGSTANHTFTATNLVGARQPRTPTFP